MKQIELHSRKYPGLFALVDDGDYELVSRYKWCPHKGNTNRTWYAIARNITAVGPRNILLHRLILGFPDYEVDHANHNGLDCQRHNLRESTDSQNEANKPKQSRPCSSRFKGVYWHKQIGKWHARIMLDGRFKSLGVYSDEVEAGKAYDRAAIGNWSGS